MRFGNLKAGLRGLPVVALLELVALLVGISFASPAMGQSSAKKVHVVRMEMKNYQFVFDPETVVVNVGDTVKWVNDSQFDHNAVSNDHKTFHSPILNPKGSWSYKAVTKGTFPYICTLHPNMKGTVIVR